VRIGILNVVDLLSFSILNDGKYLMPALNQPIFRSNAIKHYMEGREKHEFPRFISLPITILLWTLLALFVAATVLVWSEHVPTYVTTQGIVVVQSAAQPSSKSVSTTGKSVSVTGKSAAATGKLVPTTSMVVFFIPPVQVQNLQTGTSIRLNIGSSSQQINSQITSIEPGVMSPAALRSLFHLENTSLSITQPSMVVEVKLDPVLATTYAGSVVTANLQVGSQRLIALLPGVGGLFGN
jgi:hypothetical protein